MSSYLATASRRADSMNVGHGHGLVAFGLGTLSGAVASAALGAGYVAFHDKWYGKFAPYIVALTGKATALGLTLGLRSGGGVLAVVANDMGQAGVNAVALNGGMKLMMKVKGIEARIGKKGTVTGGDVLAGELPASSARGLGDDTLSVLENYR